MKSELAGGDLILRYFDEGVKVIALKGGWGTGKTYLWQAIKTELKQREDRKAKESRARPPIYASVFGLADIDAVRTALYESILEELNETVSSAQKAAKQFGGSLTQILRGIAPGTGAIIGGLGGVANVLTSAAIQRALRDRMLVLDDLERRDKKLTMSALFGFIDAMRHAGCTILLIFNEDAFQDGDAEEWKFLREKAVEREVFLETSSEKACEIGLSKSVPHLGLITQTLIRYNVRNIRVIKRLSNFLEEIFQNKTRLIETVAADLVPTTVTIICLYFGAIRTQRNIKYLTDLWRKKVLSEPSNSEDVHPENLETLISFNFTYDLQFISLLTEHITTGHPLTEEFDEHFQKRNIEANEGNVIETARQYLRDTIWNPDVTSRELVSRATSFSDNWATLSPELMSSILSDLKARDRDAADLLLEKWRQHRRKIDNSTRGFVEPNLRDYLPEIREIIEDSYSKDLQQRTLSEAILNIVNRNWTAKDAHLINSANAQQVNNAIDQLNSGTFEQFVQFYLRELASPLLRPSGEKLFPSAAGVFLAALRQLPLPPSSRSQELIRFHFQLYLQESSS
jgi:hypothetical protein